MNRIRLAVALVAVLLAGSVAGWLRPLPTLSTAAKHEPQAGWQLPPQDTLERSSAAMFAQARTLKWVGDATSAGSATAQDWILKAILSGEDAILIQSGKETLISRAEVGATLPDGSRLLAVRGDTVVVELDGCRMDRQLYPRASDSDSSECKATTLPKDMQQP